MVRGASDALSSVAVVAAVVGLGLQQGAGLSHLRTGHSLVGQPGVHTLGDGTPRDPYALPVTLGGQRLLLVPDTGSAALVVSSRRCARGDCPVRAFNPELSDTYEKGPGAQESHYVSGSVSLTEARDELKMFAQQRTQTFWEVQNLDENMHAIWKHAKFDGVLGLSQVKHVPESNETNLLENFRITSFAFCFGRTIVHPNHQGVSMTPSFMYYMSADITQPKQEHDVDVISHEFWLVRMRNLKAIQRDKSHVWDFGCSSEPGCAALLDTGSGQISIPPQFMTSFLVSIGGQLHQNCSNFDLLPDLRFSLGSVTIEMPREAYVSRKRIGEHLNCLLLMQGLAAEIEGQPAWILGLPFFREYVVQFDRSTSPARVAITKSPGSVGKGGECSSKLDATIFARSMTAEVRSEQLLFPARSWSEDVFDVSFLRGTNGNRSSYI